MTDMETVNIQKWMIAGACFLCVICFALGCYVGYLVCRNNEPTDETKPSISLEELEKVEGILNINNVKPEIPDTLVEIETIPDETIEEDVEEYVPEDDMDDSDDIDISDSEMSETEMLAIVIYQEVGGDAHCDDCRYRVADIVLNRVNSEDFPNTIYEVLTQEGQYGRLHWTGIQWADRASNTYEAAAVERAWKTAEDVLNGNHSELYGNGYIWQAGFEQGSDGFWCCGHFFGR